MKIICSAKYRVTESGRTPLDNPSTLQALEEVLQLVTTEGVDVESESVVDGELSVYAYDYRDGTPATIFVYVFTEV